MNVEEKAKLAQDILDSDVFKEAVERVEKRYHGEWLVGLTTEVREAAWAKTHVLDDVLRELRAIRDDGAVARHKRRGQNA